MIDIIPSHGIFKGIIKKYRDMSIPDVLDYLSVTHSYGRLEVVDHINLHQNRWRNKEPMSKNSSMYYEWKKGTSEPSPGRKGILYTLIQDLDTGADFIQQLVDKSLDRSDSDLISLIRQLDSEKNKQSTTLTSTLIYAIVMSVSSALKENQTKISSLEKEVSSLKDTMRRLAKMMKEQEKEKE
jgi:hypothetical protein